MRPAIATVLVLVSAAVLSAKPVGEQPAAGPDYYPLRVGSRWTYRFEGNGKTALITTAIVKVEQIDGKALARLEVTNDGKVAASTEHLMATAGAVFRARVNGLETVPPLTLLKLPPKDGDSWQEEIKVGAETLVNTSRVSKGEVEVPAGKFKTFIVRMDTVTGGKTIHNTYWFAPDIGIVKQRFELDGRGFTLDLQKFEAAK